MLFKMSIWNVSLAQGFNRFENVCCHSNVLERRRLQYNIQQDSDGGVTECPSGYKLMSDRNPAVCGCEVGSFDNENSGRFINDKNECVYCNTKFRFTTTCTPQGPTKCSGNLNVWNNACGCDPSDSTKSIKRLNGLLFCGTCFDAFGVGVATCSSDSVTACAENWKRASTGKSCTCSGTTKDGKALTITGKDNEICSPACEDDQQRDPTTFLCGVQCASGKFNPGTANTCVQCPSTAPFFSNGACVACPSNGSCDGTATLVCNANYWLDASKQCLPVAVCGDDAPAYDGTSNTCHKCSEDAPFFSGNTCTLCPSNGSCNGTARLTCNVHYWLSPSSECVPMAECDVLSATPFYDIKSNTCIKCQDSTPLFSANTCDKCSTSTPFFSGGLCTACPSNGLCDGTASVSCDVGYWLSANKECVAKVDCDPASAAPVYDSQTNICIKCSSDSPFFSDAPFFAVPSGQRAYDVKSDIRGCRPPAGLERIQIRSTNDLYKLNDLSKLGTPLVWRDNPYYLATLMSFGETTASPGTVTQFGTDWFAVSASQSANKAFASSPYFDLLPITNAMRWVDAFNGDIPEGCSPIVGGYDANGNNVYHALRDTPQGPLAGQAGKFLSRLDGGQGGAAFMPPDGNLNAIDTTKAMADGYKILCWV
ncbi:hypothetical protein OIO90_006529 [Microbotryomycetes sp. JL221]|nr:hypothetical protein OIO90_006529 [Microbotryomycetes sp. JL221]